MSTWSDVAVTSRLRPLSTPLATIWASRVVDRRVGVEAEALHVVGHRPLAELLGDLGPDGVDRVRQRGREVDRRRSPRRRSCSAARPRSPCRCGRSTRESGWYSPESIAADAVTTFIVEPGGNRPWVARLRLRAAVVADVGVDTPGLAGQHLDGAGLELERDDRALPAPAERVRGDLLRLRVERRAQVVAALARPEQRVERADELRAAARQLVVVGALEPRAAAVDRGEPTACANSSPVG